MSNYRFDIADERLKERLKIRLSFKIVDIKILSKIFKKLVRMCEAKQAIYPDFTDEEIDFAREIWNATNQIH